MQAITVYCSSSTFLDSAFHGPAKAVGRAIAERGMTLVYGGGCVGLMGEVARAAREAGGEVVGIITSRLVEMEVADHECNELIVVDTMRERKRLLEERGDGFVVLPGGIGTYEELFEILVARQLGEHEKPIGVVNSDGYYNPLAALVEHGIEHRFIRESVREFMWMNPDPERVMAWLVQSLAQPVVS